MYKIIHYNHSKYGEISDFFSSLSVFELIIYIVIITFIGYLISKKTRITKPTLEKKENETSEK